MIQSVNTILVLRRKTPVRVLCVTDIAGRSLSSVAPFNTESGSLFDQLHSAPLFDKRRPRSINPLRVLRASRSFFFFPPSRELRPLALSLSASHSVSICLKMAANAGSMFQYWKRFDLQQLQVSLSLTHFALLSQRFLRPRSGCSAVFAALRRCFFGLASFFPGPSVLAID